MGNRLFEEFSPVSKNTWKEKLIKDLKGRPYEKLIQDSEAGIAIEPLYAREDLPNDVAASFPGRDDFRRGSSLLVHAAQAWELCQSLHFSSVDNIMAYLEGQNPAISSLRLNLDSTLRNALDNNIQNTSRYRQYDGLWISKWDELQPVFDWAKKHNSKIWLGLGEQGTEFIKSEFRHLFDGVSGGISLNPVVLDRKYPDWISDLANFLKRPGLHADAKLIEIDLAPWELRAAKGTSQIAYALAMAVELSSQLESQGIGAKEVFERISFRFAVGTEFLTEIAKIRAFRSLWSNVLRAYGLDLPGNFFHIQAVPALSSETVADPQVNLLRATTEAMSAIFAGCDLIELPAYDYLFSEPQNLPMRIARNIHLVLREESDLGRVIDPAGGAFFLENATDQLAESAWKEFQEIESQGGWYQCLETGIISAALEKEQIKREIDVQKAKKVILGTNLYPKEAEKLPQMHKTEAARGEIFYELQDLDKRHKFANRLKGGKRSAADFEALRLRVQAEENLPTILLFGFGNPAMRAARLNFSRSLFAAAGLICEEINVSDNFEQSLSEAKARSAALIVICSSDDDYAQVCPELIPQLKSSFPNSLLVLAGRPPAWEEFQKLGLNDAIFGGMNRYEFLKNLLETLKIGKEAQNEA